MTSGEEEAAPQRRDGRPSPVSAHGGVTRAELFLDLVFVFAFINVAALMSARSHQDALVQGGLVLLLLWRSWAGYAWVGNLVRLDRGSLPVAVFLVATAILLVAVVIPEVFADRRGGLSGPLVFVVGFLAVRAGALLIIAVAYRGRVDPSATPARRAWPPLALSASLLLCGVLLPNRLSSVPHVELLQLLFFALATVIDYLGLRAVGVGSVQLTSVRHWAERHSLVMLMALGETIISIGTSRGFVGDKPITWSVLLGSVLGLVVVAFLWWAYFDIAALDAERALESTSGPSRARLARDAYTLLHLPMIGGLILVSFGLKHALGATEPGTAKEWGPAELSALYGGVVLYLIGLVAFEWRTVRRIGRGPVLGIVLVALLMPVARQATAVVSLGILAGALVCLVLAHVTVLRRRHRRLHGVVAVSAGREVDVTPEDLFLDLVFVFAFIQVTVLMTRNPDTAGVFRALAVLALVWWSWINHTWFTTMVRGSPNVRRLIALVVAALTLTLGIAAPQAFSDPPGGLPGPLIVVASYVTVRGVYLAALWVATRRHPPLRAPVVGAAVPTTVAAVLLLGAALADRATGGPLTLPATLLWVAAIVVDLSGGYLIGSRNWQLGSVSRWMGRYNLIILIALGQAVIATGMAAGGAPASGSALLNVGLSALLLSALWWTYVGTDVAVGQRFAELTTRHQRGALARDAYTYLHLFLVVGLVLVAFGLRTAASPGPPGAPLLFGRITLVCGVILFLLTDHLIWRRARRTVGRRRALSLVVAALAPATILLPVPWAIATLTVALSIVHLLGRTATPPLDSVVGDRH
ncbi:low temperature requirement protein A [Micromonospora costi]|uniref:Low temperature requirement protein A n=1 Tax=Micromonospora costi TaxID=1530042 RepID=A0A3A9ZV81_9ACTN|nr:low temperature requirement protein A [Micromonospora costi]RKN52129.1 hypothetical protein D7193_26600 [Micromonospora costi]